MEIGPLVRDFDELRRDLHELRSQIRDLEQEVDLLRRRQNDHVRNHGA